MARSDVFNETWYLRNNPDIAAAVEAGLIDARTHFDAFGRFEGRSPGPAFDPAYYRSQNPDVDDAIESGLTTAYDHFMAFGAGEDRNFVSYFDSTFYASSNPDIADAIESGDTTAIDHFLTYGQSEPRPVSPFFDLAAYIEANPDLGGLVAEGGISPLDHLLTYGFAEGRPLGNGINLEQFANDPTFQDALAEGGNPLDALARVAEVAPFLPTFEPPANWEPPADTPIPVGFVPVEGEKLVVPPSVEVPDDVELPPDVFEPVEPGEPGDPGDPGGPSDEVNTVYGETVSDVAINPASDSLWVGEGNSPENFTISTTSESQFELALKGYLRDSGDTEVVSETNPNYAFAGTDKTGFAYSLAALGGATLVEKIDEGYSFYLNIDIDPSSEEQLLSFKLQAEEAPTDGEDTNDSGFQWVYVDEEGNTFPEFAISDDEGNVGPGESGAEAAVTQNIQTPIWYGTNLEIGDSGVLKGGEYSVSLQVYDAEERVPENLVVAQGIVLDVEELETDYGGTLNFGQDGDTGNAYVGSGNTAANFAIHEITIGSNDEGGEGGAASDTLEIALGGQNRGGPVYGMDGDGVITVPAGDTAAFRFSIATEEGAEQNLVELLATYDIRILVDTDSGEGTDFVTMEAVAGTSESGGALDWVFPDVDVPEPYRIDDDGGNQYVSQNIQALGWYQGEPSELFTSDEIAPGSYTVAIEVYEQGMVDLVGATQVVFEVESSAVV